MCLNSSCASKLSPTPQVKELDDGMNVTLGGLICRCDVLPGCSTFAITQSGAYIITLSSAMAREWSSQVFSVDLSNKPLHSEKTMKCAIWPTIRKLSILIRLERLTEKDFKVRAMRGLQANAASYFIS